MTGTTRGWALHETAGRPKRNRRRNGHWPPATLTSLAKEFLPRAGLVRTCDGDGDRSRTRPADGSTRRFPPLDRHQMLKRGSPVFEMASAIQALALALSAIRSARDGALSLSPPALMYSCAILPSDRQFSELSYFTPRSWTSTTHRFAASLSRTAIDSSCDAPGEHAVTSHAIRSIRAVREPYAI
jgi:hypothetical protein